MGCSPWGRKELDTTERLTHTHTHTHTRARLLKGNCKIIIIQIGNIYPLLIIASLNEIPYLVLWNFVGRKKRVFFSFSFFFIGV